MKKLHINIDHYACDSPFDDKKQTSERFDYTDWQHDLWEDRSLEDIHFAAAEYFEKTHPNRISEEKRLPNQ